MALPPDGFHPTTARDGFGRRPHDRYIEIPDGEAGHLATLSYVADLIQLPDPAVQVFAAQWVELADAQGLTDTELAASIFAWVQRHIRYTPDVETEEIAEEIRSPAYLLHEIARRGSAEEDCDGYVGLLGATYYQIGWPVTLIAVSTRPDAILDHLFLSVAVDGAVYAADGIMSYALGWEIPHAEQTARVEWPVAA